MAYKGKFRPHNIKKYRGNHKGIIYRSLWELRFMRYCDSPPSILEWASEELIIPYRSPVDGKKHRYFPDFWLKVKTAEGEIKESVVEIKPKIQTKPPKKRNKITRKYLKEVKTWGVNEAKWKAAEAFCKDRDWKFKIITEKDLTKY